MPIHPGRILFEDEYVLAVNKLSGELVVKGAGKVGRLPLLDFLKKQYPGLQTLHRLDFETSGVVVFAKNRAVLASVHESDFAGWEKTYRTIVVGNFSRKTGEIAAPLPARTGKGNVPALTRYRVLEEFPLCSFVEVDIATGRQHQIRRHFAGIGHPLVLDDRYGEVKFNRKFTREFRFHRFFLHAFSIEFLHPFTGKIIFIEAPLPGAFEEALRRVKQ